MKYTVISDIHANLSALEVFLEFYDSSSHLLCLGDTIGYGAHPGECLHIIRKNAVTILAGNHEAILQGRDFHFNPIAQTAIDWTREHLSADDQVYIKTLPLETIQDSHYLLVHGSPGDPFRYLWDSLSLQNASYFLEENKLQLCFFGHTHVPGIYQKGAFIRYKSDIPISLDNTNPVLINPGSIGQPRDGDPRLSWVEYDQESQSVVFRRKSYDVDCAARDIIEAGLPPSLGERLRLGH